MNLSEDIVRYIRTYVPFAVGFVFSTFPFLADFVNVDGQALTALAVAVYYGAVRLLEQVHPAFGWLLGSPKE